LLLNITILIAISPLELAFRGTPLCDSVPHFDTCYTRDRGIVGDKALIFREELAQYPRALLPNTIAQKNTSFSLSLAMAPDAPNPDDDLSPQDFLRRVRQMTLERDREDKQRATDLEKEISQSREQRRARRAGESSCCLPAPLLFLPTLSAVPLTMLA
jgi:hypothetical protein